MNDLPPLQQSSLAAKVLLDVWSGRRISHHTPPVIDDTSTIRHRQIPTAAIVAAHMNERAGLAVEIIAGRKPHRVALYREVTAAAPGATVAVNGVTFEDLGGVSAPKRTSRGIWVRRPYARSDPPPVDLVIVVDATSVKGPNLLTYLAAGRQLVAFGANNTLRRLRLDDRDDLTPPLDVMIAAEQEQR